MTISSRTPEGIPHRCPVCGEVAALSPSFPGGDACCPACGHLLWWFRDRLSAADSIIDAITLESSLEELGLDSLDTVELVMALEEEFDVNIPDDDAAKIETIMDAIHFVRRHRGDEAA